MNQQIALLKQARHSAGLSQEQVIVRIEGLGRAMGVALPARSSLRTLLSAYENGHRKVPEQHRPIFRELYHATDIDLGFQHQTTLLALPALPEANTANPGRPTREILAYLANVRAEQLRLELNDTLSLGAMTEATLEGWEQTAIRYARATRDRPVGVLLSDISNDLVELKRVLGQHHSTSAMRRLTRVTAQMSGLMCLIFCVLDDRSAFRRWARTARFAANETGDPETLSWILAQEAYGHYYSGDRLEAIDVARHAYEAVRVPCAGAALAAALAARAHATMGRSQEAREALARAEHTLSRLDGDVLIPSAFGYNEASFRFHQGNAYTHLHDVKSAFEAQERALELGEPEDYIDWGMTRLDRAQCLIYSGYVTSGLEYATDTIASLTEPQRHGIITLRVRRVIEALPEGAKKLVTARDLREALMLTAGNNEVES